MGHDRIRRRTERERPDDGREHAVAPHALPPGLGNQATGRLIQTLRAPSGPVLQRRWIVNQYFTQYFWEDDGDEKDYDELPEWMLSAMELDPPPREYQVDDGKARLRRGGAPVWYTLDHAVKTWLGKAKGARTHDVYNPFGRFATANVNSFIPSRALGDQGKAILEALAADKSYQPVQAVSKELDATGYPVTVTVAGGTLGLVEVTDFGAVYSSVPPSGRIAAHDPAKAQPASELGLNVDGPSRKQVFAYKITPTVLASWEGKKRSISQKAVMGEGAGDVAANAGYAKKEGKGWEWLHLIAHSMGGISGAGPQVPENLVVGTSECNTQMIVVEEWVKDAVIRSGGHAVIYVGVELFDDGRHIGKHIGYDIELYNKAGLPVAVQHYVFDPLSRTQPLAFVNRVERYASREAYPEGAEAATTHIPRSQPTAHTSIEAVRADEPTQIVEQAKEVFRRGNLDELREHLKAVRGAGKLRAEVFHELADLLQPAQVMPFLRMLKQTEFAERAILHTIYSYLINQPAAKGWMLKDVLTPLYAPQAVPDKLRAQCA